MQNKGMDGKKSLAPIEVLRSAGRFNCRVCGAINPVSSEIATIPPGYGADFAHLTNVVECVRCRSAYSVASASVESVAIEVSAVQREFSRSAPGSAPKRPKRDAIYADPVYGPIRRAQDRLRRAEIDLAQAMASAHLDAGESIRAIALSAGISKSSAHALIKRTADDYALKRKPQNREVVASLPPIPLADADIPF